MCRRYILTLKYVIDNGYAIYTPEYDICLLICFIGSGIRDGCSDTLYVHQIILLNYRYAHPREIIGIRTSLHSRVHHWHVNMLFTRYNIFLMIMLYMTGICTRFVQSRICYRHMDTRVRIFVIILIHLKLTKY